MRFAHIADTHIRNLKYHKEYRAVFSDLYESLKENKIDCIVHCGDIAHTKTQISPEFVDLCSDFFKNLADIAPTYIILGNHDGNLRASTRQDAITPIVKALNHDNIFLLKKSGETSLDENFSLNVLSVFDEEGWVDPACPDKVNIALYHGSISNCLTDTGWEMDRGDHEISIFQKHDYAFLGDIHKAQSLDAEGRVQYAGSTVQQNFGEDDNKGYLLWDIQDKEIFETRHIKLNNPRPFITVQMTEKGKLPRGLKVPEGCRLRLVANTNLPLDVVRKAVDTAKTRFKPESIVYLNRLAGDRGEVNIENAGCITENLRDPAVQEDLLKEYLDDFKVDDENLEKVCELNKKYDILATENEEVSRNIHWKLKKIEWDNLFNYAEGNQIDFENLNGIVGIFGKNFSGKSSIVDTLLYGLFNSTSKNNRKNINLINQNKEEARAKIELAIGHNRFVIDRSSEKYNKKVRGVVTKEAKTDIDFVKIDDATLEETYLNGTTRNETDKNIRKMFGTLEDFLMTSMSSQLGSLSFINEGSTRRKEILAKFLDLEIFEKKFKLAKDDSMQIRAGLKRHENRDFDSEISDAKRELIENEILMERKKAECEEINNEAPTVQAEILEITKSIDAIPAEVIDIDEVCVLLETKKSDLENNKLEKEKLKEQFKNDSQLLEKIEEFLKSYDQKSLQQKNDKLQLSMQELEKNIIETEKNNRELEINDTKAELLKKVPCGDEYTECMFKKDAYQATADNKTIKVELDRLALFKNEVTEEIQVLKDQQVEEQLDKYNKISLKKSEVESSLSTIKLKAEKNKVLSSEINLNIEKLESKKRDYEDNKEAIENLESLIKKRTTLQAYLKKIQTQYDYCQQEVNELYKTLGSAEQKIKNIEEEKAEVLELRSQYAAYDLYLQCMHSNGISYDIIKKKLPVINEEISKIVTNVVDFSVFFDDDGKRLNVFIKHPKHDPRPIEMGSGAEKTIAAMAIRLALVNVTTLPKSDIFILDEPGTALDEENMEGFIRMLDMVKNQFKTVILISHLESLKDTADITINIEKSGGYAYVNQ